MSEGAAIHRLDRLDPADAEGVRRLIGAASAHDGFSALNEAAVLELSDLDSSAVHLLATTSDGLVGYAQLDPAPDAVVGSLVVHPDHRWAGVGDALLTRLIGEAGAGLRIWAPHHTAAAESLAARHRLEPIRRLLIMIRDLDGGWPAAPPPDGLAVRAFVPGRDEAAWLTVNARAFATHPEQGRVDRHDLDQRMSEPWFDPAGFLLAVRDSDGQVVGFHWTKRHSAELGEVYVLGVDPTAGIRGLGRPLLSAGLDHLRGAGATQVILYVESDNAPARRLYGTAGFRVLSTDVLYGT